MIKVPRVTDRIDEDVSRGLVAACRGHEVRAAADPMAQEALVRAARFHRIAPLVHAALKSTSTPLSTALSMDRSRAIAVHLQACHALHQLDRALDGIPWLTFKGPVLSETAHPVPGLRSYHDVDVLVGPGDLREACRRLGESGWRLADYQDMLRNPETPGEIHWISPNGVIIDLHWSMINMASRRQGFAVPTDQLLRGRVPVHLGSQRVWTMQLPDSLVHVCLHAALTGADRLIFLVDADRLSRRVSDWNDVAQRAVAWRAQAQVALVLDRAHRFLSTNVPGDIDRRLGLPYALRVMTRMADAAAPVPRVRRDRNLAKFVARAIRPTTPATVGLIGRHALQGIKDRTLGSVLSKDVRRTADDESLDAYLSAVEAAIAR